MRANDAVCEAALVEQVEVDPHAVGERRRAATHDDGRQEEVDLVDEAGAKRLGGGAGVRALATAASVRE